MKRILLALSLILLAPFAAAQDAERSFPDYTSTTLNDFARLLTNDAAGRVEDALKALKADHGVEMTVVTLDTRHDFGPWATMERFTTALFNHWGVGNAERNDGIMVLVLRQDREMRIELGMGYNRDYDWVAQQVIDDFFLPRFKENDYSVGIEAGVNATIREIALPLAEGRAPEAPGILDRIGDAIFYVAFGLVMILSFFGRKISDLAMRTRRCPNCGARGTLRRSRKFLRSASRSMSGQGERTTRCTNCDYKEHRLYTIPRIASSTSRGGFGGGSSSGGGASGRW